MMNRDDQSSRVLSRAETDAINSILDEEEMRFGQFSSLSPNLSALDEQCKQIWSNWESIPTSTAKTYRKTPQEEVNFRPSSKYDNDIFADNFEPTRYKTNTNNRSSIPNNENLPNYDAFLQQDKFSDKYQSPSQKFKSNLENNFALPSRPPPNIDDITGITANRYKSYNPASDLNSNNFDFNNVNTNRGNNVNNLGGKLNSPLSDARRDLDFLEGNSSSMTRKNGRGDLFETDVGNLKNEIDSIMATVRSASRSPVSASSPRSSNMDQFSIPSKSAPLSGNTDFLSKKFQSPLQTKGSELGGLPDKDLYMSPKISMKSDFISSTSKTSTFNPSSSLYSKTQLSSSPRATNSTASARPNPAAATTNFNYMNNFDDSYLQNSVSLNDDSFGEPINIKTKTSTKPVSTLNTGIPSTAANLGSPSQPESLRLQQENVRLKAELLKAQKQLQAEKEENQKLLLSLEKSEQLRQRYKEKIAMYQKQIEQMQSK
ncbi:hypothetical protein TRFO_01957 [Tritrichomonas foetus]|uniref:Uncharacterized protein n=1 Tax=Tritrichomonas foetus TaxID=1144522 RepID=A0A1J4JCG9_9EUKA|nr:hypothetical protein TRFO_01957 [Tritrichomonas foetus]|eukprot:OHS96878.1 hypothetical protein TRFO_01957 [Tritrichomonas foetus]